MTDAPEPLTLTINDDIGEDAERAWIATRLHGMPQTVVAAKLGVDRKTVHRWLVKIDEDIANHYRSNSGLTLLGIELQRLKHQEERIERDVYRLRQKYKVVDGVPRWSERTELAICRQEKLLLEIRKARFEMLCKTGLIATGLENRSQLKDALDAPTHRQDKYENEMTQQEIYDQIAQTLKKVKRIQ